MNNLVANRPAMNRLLAAWVDNIVGMVLSVIVLKSLSFDSDMLSISTMGLTYLLYFFIFEAIFARTPGKMLAGLIVRKIDGGQIGPKEALIRTVSRVIETNPLLLGGLPAGVAILVTKNKQRLGDIAAATVVVSRRGI